MLKMDEKGKPYYEDGELLPANISFNYKNKNTYFSSYTHFYSP